MDHTVDFSDLDKKIDDLTEWQLNWIFDQLKSGLYRNLSEDHRRFLDDKKDDALPTLLLALSENNPAQPNQVAHENVDIAKLSKSCLKIYARFSQENKDSVSILLGNTPINARSILLNIGLLYAVAIVMATEVSIKYTRSSVEKSPGEKQKEKQRNFEIIIKKPSLNYKEVMELAKRAVKKLPGIE